VKTRSLSAPPHQRHRPRSVENVDETSPVGDLVQESASDVATLAKGGALQVIGRVSSRLLSFAFIPIAVRILGAAKYGLYREVTQVLLVGALLGPGGFQFAAVRFIAQARTLRRHGAVRGSATVALWGGAIASLLVFAGLIVLARPIANYFAAGSSNQRELAGLLRMGAPFVPLYSMTVVLLYCTQGYRTLLPTVAVNDVGLPLARFLLGIAAILAGFEVSGLMGALVLSAAISLGGAVWFFKKLFTEEERSAVPDREVKAIVRFSLLLGASSLFSTQSLGLGIILLGIFSNDRSVGLFAVALALQTAGGVFLQSLVGIWAPIVASVYEQRDLERLQSLYRAITRWIVSLAFPIYVALIVIPDFFGHLVGGENAADVAPLIAILAIGNIFYAGTGPAGQMLIMTGRPRVNLLNSIASVVVYIVLGAILVPKYGAIGMAAVDAGVTIALNLVVVFEGWILVGVHPFGRSFVKPLGAAAVFGVFLLLWRILLGTGLVVEGLGLGVASLLYFGLLLKLGMDPEERFVYGRIRQRLSSLSRRHER
jgi:O-antigen/teichoic acid export membrane protein